MSPTALGMSTPPVCAVEDLGVAAAPLQVRMGTPDNIALSGPGVPRFFQRLDLAGIWAMHVESTSGWMSWLLAAMHLEVLASFAGSFVEGTTLHIPDSVDHQWGYSSTFPSLALMWYHAQRRGLEDTLGLQFVNTSFAKLGDLGEVVRRNDNEWLQTSFILGQRVDVVFSRMVYANGTVGASSWQRLLSDLSGYGLRIWGDDNLCRRRCETTVGLLLLPSWAACRWCSYVC